MAEYPHLEADPLPAAVEAMVAAVDIASRHIALPPRRLDLQQAAKTLQDVMEERARG